MTLCLFCQIKRKIKEAIKEHKKAIKIDPDYADPYSHLGDIYYFQNKFEEAVESYNKATEIDPNNAKFHKKLAETLEILERYDEANIHWKKYLDINPWVYDSKSILERMKNNKTKQKS